MVEAFAQWKCLTGKVKCDRLGGMLLKKDGQHIFSRACFGQTKKLKCSTVTSKREEGGTVLVWFSRTVILLRLKGGEGSEERKMFLP